MLKHSLNAKTRTNPNQEEKPVFRKAWCNLSAPTLWSAQHSFWSDNRWFGCTAS
jgi:hypothetical protein